MFVVDANVWVSRFLVGEERHQESSLFMDRIHERRERILLPELALPEVAGHLARRTGGTEIAIRALSALLASPLSWFYPLGRELAHLSALLAAHLSLRGADAVYVALAQTHRVPLVTWDQELVARASVAVPSLTPVQVLSI